MKLGVTFPQVDIGNDPAVIADYARTIEELGFDYILIWDHVLGADPSVRPDWRPLGPDRPLIWWHEHAFHEPLVLLGFLAACTERLELATGILILPQRQTALAAKQTAEADVLAGGRLRLGVGLGWNDVEFEALGGDFHVRGKRVEEQVALLRELWTKPVVTFEGRWDRVTAAGINPLPVQRPIPVWFGGNALPVMKRVARIGDGWFPGLPPGPKLDEAWGDVRQWAEEAGRDPAAIGLEGQISPRMSGLSFDQVLEVAGGWRAAGATHLCINTMSSEHSTLGEHLAYVRRFKKGVDDG